MHFVVVFFGFAAFLVGTPYYCLSMIQHLMYIGIYNNFGTVMAWSGLLNFFAPYLIRVRNASNR